MSNVIPFWVVTGTKGEYSDTTWWIVGVYADRAEADGVCAALKAQDTFAITECARIRHAYKIARECAYQAYVNAKPDPGNVMRDAWLATCSAEEGEIAAMMGALPLKVLTCGVSYNVEGATNVPGVDPDGVPKAPDGDMFL